MSHYLFLISSIFPEPDRLIILAMFIQANGEVLSVFRQRALYHKKYWQHDSTRMVLRCLHGILNYGTLDFGHLKALFYRRRNIDTLFFGIMLRKIWIISPELRNQFVANNLSRKNWEKILSTVDQYIKTTNRNN